MNNDEKKVLVELSLQELNLAIIGMTSAQYPLKLQEAAFTLVLKLRDKIRETA
jgi:hypothetical protein